MNDEYKAVIMMNLRDFDAGRTARHGTYDLGGKLAELERVYAKVDEYEAKAKAFDESLKGFKKLERLHEEVQKSSKRNRERSEAYKETLTHVISKMESDLGESGEMGC